MNELITFGQHAGTARRLARGVRLACRSYVSRWRDEYLDPAVALSLIEKRFQFVPRTADFVTWVPGHDGTPGPGYYLAACVASAWKVPLIEVLARRNSLPSAHSALIRPTLTAARDSLQVIDWKSQGSSLLVVDNVIASGASMLGALDTLDAANYRLVSAFAISVDLDAGSRQHILSSRGGLQLHRSVAGRAPILHREAA